MFYWISKILHYFLAPSAWILAAILWIWLGKSRERIRRRALIAFGLIYLLMNSFLVDEVMRRWELPLKSVNEIDTVYAAAVVLGGHMVTMDHSTDRRIFRAPADRVIQALELYKQDRVFSIILSGGPSHPLHQSEFEAAWLRDFLLVAGVPHDDILVDSTSRNTYENAKNVAMILQQAGIQDTVLLITSASHMRRAAASFREAGIAIHTYPADKWVGSRRYDLEHLLVPDTDALLKWRILVHEMIGWVAYKLAGYA